MLTLPIKALILAVIAMSAGARDWYIDPEKGSDETGDGTQGSPFLTINRASTNTLFTAGETIYLAPGDYKVGHAEETVTKNGVSYIDRSRVLLPKRTILDSTLGEAGVEKTRIFGLRVDDPNGYTGSGDGAIRCIHAKAANTHIRNLTLIDGASTWTNAAESADFQTQQGGAIRCVSTSTYLVNCIVTNCSGRGGSIHNATAIRCRIVGNKGRSVLRTGKAYFSFFDGNEIQSGGAVISYSSVVNCTIVNSSSQLYQGNTDNPPYAANCIHALYNGGYGVSGANDTNNYGVTLGSFSATANPFINAFEGDFRLRDCDAVSKTSSSTKDVVRLTDKGDWNLLTAKFTVPDEYAYKGERLHLGCFDAFVPAGGAFNFSQKVQINGKLWPLTDKKSFYMAWPTTYPSYTKALCVTDDPTTKIYNMWRPTGYGGNLYVEPDASGTFLPPADNGVCLSVSAQTATQKLYVDGENPAASDDNPGTEDQPFKTIQAAVDRATSDRPIILVKPGTYTGSHEVVAKNNGKSFTVRAAVAVTNHTCVIRSTGGAGVTFIEGAPDPDTLADETYPGLGPKAVRCIYNYPLNSSGSGQVQGFTLRNGYSDKPDTDLVCRRGGAMLGFSNSLLTLSDSVVSNCFGAESLIDSVFVKRCRIVDNFSANYVLNSSRVVSSVIAGNRSNGNLAGGDTWLYCDTWYGNTSAGSQLAANTYVFNSILDGNGGKQTVAPHEYGGNFAWNFAADDKLPDAFVRADPQFAAPETGDFRPVKGSPVIDNGACGDYISTASQYLCSSDLLCQMPRLTADGVMTPGALQTDFPSAVYIACPNGGLAISGGKVGANLLTGEEAVTITASGTGTRPCVGYTVNGVTNLFANVPSKTITAADLAAADGKITVEAVYTSDWYVNEKTGSDAASGFTPETPFKTLAAALTNALLKAGDTVHAAPGVYREGTIVTPVACSTVTPSRAAVPSGVTLEGADPETTVILGGEQVHCVALPAGARVRNFTLTGAKLARVDYKAGTDYPGESDTGAAAVLGADEATSIAENCIISNNVAFRRAAGLRCTFVRCRILDNLSDTAPAGCYVTCHHCLIDGNRGQYIAMYSSYYNTTFTPDNLGLGGGETPLAYYFSQTGNYHCWENGFRALNTVIPGKVCTNHCYRYCALCSDVETNSKGVYVDAGIAGEGSIITNKAAYTFDEKGFPTKGNPIIDASNLAWVRENMKAGDTLDSDLAGGQRVYNGTLDMGCYEYDWRGDYAKDLSAKRGLRVTEAGTNVVETAEKAVRVSADNDLTALWTSREPVLRDYEMKAQVSGAGTLTVKLNGIVLATVTDADELKTLAFKNDLTANTVEFTFAGEGCADLSGFTRTGNGILLLVR